MSQELAELTPVPSLLLPLLLLMSAALAAAAGGRSQKTSTRVPRRDFRRRTRSLRPCETAVVIDHGAEGSI